MNRYVVALALLLSAAHQTPAQPRHWSIPSDAPLLTRWSRQVNPDQVLPEYPRPQFARTEWKNLNGLWQWTEAKEDEAPPISKSLPGSILVPFPVESALSGVMKHVDRLWYRRTFTVPKSWNGQRLLLHCGAVDWESVVYVNGTAIGAHRGGYDAFTFDITDALKGPGRQELIIGVDDPTDTGDQARGKQVLKPGSIWYTPTTGIWQTVWLEPVPHNYLNDLILVPEPEEHRVRMTLLSSESRGTVNVRVLDRGKPVASGSGDVGEQLLLQIRSPKLWSPDTPFLYDLKIQLKEHGKVVDEVTSYVGLRSVAVRKDSQGTNRIELNGKPMMLVGPLDQGFWPDGIYSAPTDEALRSDIEMTRRLGFNMTRKHVKVEPDRWYYWADKLGLLVWQDMPSADNKTMSGRDQFEHELKRLVLTHRNHPSIMMWVVFNEGWGQYDTGRLTAWVRELDSTRLVNNASGWTDKKAGDVLDIHSYPVPKSPGPDSSRASVLGEFGGLGLALDGHTWKKEHWGYQGMKSKEQLTAKYEAFMKRVYDLRATEQLSAAVYTQLTDVEIECNGLLTYDRAVVKPDRERVSRVNRGDFSLVPPPPVLHVIVPTSQDHPRPWRYTFGQPAESWVNRSFNDSAWQSGPGGFGTRGTPGAVVGTEWKSSDIWIRQTFNLAEVPPDSLVLILHHDEDAEVFVNGVLASGETGWTSEYELVGIGARARAALQRGENMLAVHCHQTEGGQFIDAGLAEVIAAGRKTSK